MPQTKGTIDRKRSVQAGKKGILVSILAVAIGGSFYAAGNFVGDTGANPNVSFVNGFRAVLTPQIVIDSNTGGVKSGDATYDTLLASSPYDSTASTRGLRTGSGVVRFLQFDIISNPEGVGFDCTKVGSVNSATGGTVFVDNVSATGSINIYSTPFALGPTEYVKCGTRGTMAAPTTFSGSLRLYMGDSDVVN